MATDRRLHHLRRHVAESLSIQAAATWTMEHREWDFLAVYFRAIDELSHHFMPFHPPRMEGVPEREFELYHDVVKSAYRFHDLMLRRLIALAGPDATIIVISDHGFHSDHLRPRAVPKIPAGITVWHRPQGLLAAAGPDLLRDELVFGASLLDITPTILPSLDCPWRGIWKDKSCAKCFRNRRRTSGLTRMTNQHRTNPR
jgi:predicted AlkP superfamily phosphohydrolase/phosphomutase